MKTLQRYFALALIGAVALTGCKKKTDTAAYPDSTTNSYNTATSQPDVNDVVLCRQVTSDMQPIGQAETFSPKDTIRAIVRVANATGSEKVGVTWFYKNANGGEQQIRHDEATVAHGGAVSTPFMVSKPDGWPTGAYHVDATLNGQMKKSMPFTVK